MKYRRHIGLSFVFFALVFTSCTIKKRTYRNGYYISWNSRLKETKADNKNICEKENTIFLEQTYSKEIDEFPSESEEVKVIVEREKYSGNDSCNDIILLRTGDEVRGKIIKITDTRVDFFNCKKDVIEIMDPDNIFMAKTANGSKKVFKIIGEKKQNSFADASLYFSCLSLFALFAPSAIILGIVGLIQMRMNPGKYDGKWRAVLGILLNILGLALFILYIAIVMSL